MLKEARIRLLIGIPSIRNDERFLASFDKFLEIIKLKYEVTVAWRRFRKLADAQNSITDDFIYLNYDYLLFLDDDHWGHSLAMLDCLINANADIAAIKTYSRYFPYNSVLFGHYDGLDGFIPIEYNKGYHKIDFTGFAMTLIRRNVFDILDRPYFRERISGKNEWATDHEFFERARSHNLKIIGCCQYCLPHDDVTDDNVIEKRINNRNSYRNRLLEKCINKENVCLS